ncbi:hypothetical protein ACQP04_02510 [Pseudonocardia halophobica]|uniref:hypothetical protein n=1 Tax=Pseudonocardia halophobica TaxID=29401 RepID=UPI003D9502B3
MNRGAISKRCTCTELVDGRRRQLGARCPRLRRADGSWNPRHGWWGFTLTVPGPGGKPRQLRHWKWDTRQDAEAALDSARTGYRNGASRIGLQLGTYLAEWITARTDLADTSHRNYSGHIRNHLTPRLGHLKLDDLRVAHVAEAFADIPVSDSTRQRIRATLGAR